MTATVSAERAMTIQRRMASFKEGTVHPLKAFQKMLDLMAAASPVLQLGLLHVRPIQYWLKQRVPSAVWHHGRHRIMVNRVCVSALTRWKDPLWLKQGVILDTAHRRKVVTTDASNKGWGALCEGKPTFGLWSEEESDLHINCLEMLAVCRTCQFFRPDIRGHHVLIRSDSRSVVSYINHQGGLVSKRLCTLALTEGNAYAGQNEPRSRHVVKEQHLLRGMDAPPARGSANLGSLWQSSSRPLRLRRQLSLPNLFHKEHGCPGPRVAQPSALCVPSIRSATAGTQTS